MASRVRSASAIAVAALAVAGCSSAKTANSAGTYSTSTGSTPPKAAASPPITGTRLTSALLPASYFGTGYRIDTQGTSDSGAIPETGPAESTVPGVPCDSFYGTFGNSGYGESAYTTRVAEELRSGYFGETIYHFLTAAAAAVLASGIRTEVGSCRSLIASISDGTQDPVTLGVSSQAPISGYPAFAMESVLIHAGGDGAVTWRSDYVIVRAGADVYEVQASSASGYPPAAPLLRSVASRLIARVAALR